MTLKEQREREEREHCEEAADKIDCEEGRHLRRDHIFELLLRERAAAVEAFKAKPTCACCGKFVDKIRCGWCQESDGSQ